MEISVQGLSLRSLVGLFVLTTLSGAFWKTKGYFCSMDVVRLGSKEWNG